MITKSDVIKAIKIIRGEVLPMNFNTHLIVQALLLYKQRSEWDGSLESAIQCLKQAEYEIKEDS